MRNTNSQKPKMTQLIIRIPELEKQFLVDQSRKNGQSLSELARNIFRSHIKKQTKKYSNIQLAEDLTAISSSSTKKVAAGLTSETYKDYLYGEKAGEDQ